MKSTQEIHRKIEPQRLKCSSKNTKNYTTSNMLMSDYWKQHLFASCTYTQEQFGGRWDAHQST